VRPRFEQAPHGCCRSHRSLAKLKRTRCFDGSRALTFGAGKDRRKAGLCLSVDLVDVEHCQPWYGGMYNKIEALAEPSHVKKRKKLSGSVNREAMEKATTVRVDRPCAAHAHDTCSSDPPCPLALRVPILLSKSPVWLYIQRYSAVTGAINPCAKTIAMAPLHLLFHPVVVRPLPCLLYI
jgi:hypothetical protein